MPFLDLPPEIREDIYKIILEPSSNRHHLPNDYSDYTFSPSLVLYRINRQIYLEARKVFRDLNILILIETPWMEAQHHVAMEGHVPILATGHRAAVFDAHTMIVSINAPGYQYTDEEVRRFVILLDDLPKFTTMWKYSNLSHPGLNNHLSLTLKLRDPRISSTSTEWEDPHIPRAVQARLLEPFGEVKNLAELHVTGSPTPYPSLVKQLKEAQAIPPESPEECLRQATRLKDEGNAALKASKYNEALEWYRKAWLALHIVINGKQRHIHGDAYFNREMVEEPFKGQQGHTIRLILRVRLVANTVLAYLRMSDYENATHWAKRTINMIRQAIGLAEDEAASRPEDEAILNFVAAPEMGKIYFRAALAYKAIDNLNEARKLLKVAVVYLPDSQEVHREISACAPRIL